MNKCALVVNDQPEKCDLLAELSKSEGIDLVAVGNSAEAITQAHDRKFDLVFVDIPEPGDGIELIRRIRGSGFNRLTPIVMMSDSQQLGALSGAFAAGASFFVTKPVDRARLLKLMLIARGAIEHERRRFRRVPVQVKVSITHENTQLDGETIDLSLNGALIKASKVFPAGSSVDLNFYLQAEARPVTGTGSVIRSAADTMGIRFDYLPVSESSRLQDFLLPLISV